MNNAGECECDEGFTGENGQNCQADRKRRSSDECTCKNDCEPNEDGSCDCDNGEQCQAARKRRSNECEENASMNKAGECECDEGFTGENGQNCQADRKRRSSDECTCKNVCE